MKLALFLLLVMLAAAIGAALAPYIAPAVGAALLVALVLAVLLGLVRAVLEPFGGLARWSDAMTARGRAWVVDVAFVGSCIGLGAFLFYLFL